MKSVGDVIKKSCNSPSLLHLLPSSLQFLEYFQLHLNVHICDKCLFFSLAPFGCACVKKAL